MLMQMLAADCAAAVAWTTDEHDVETYVVSMCALFSISCFSSEAEVTRCALRVFGTELSSPSWCAVKKVCVVGGWQQLPESSRRLP